MGGPYGGAFAAGLVNSLRQGQEMQMNKAYREALMQQTKAQVKMLESQEVIKNFEIMKNMAGMAEMTGQPLEKVMQLMPASQQQPQPQQGQSILGAIINKITGGQPQAQAQMPGQPMAGAPQTQPLPNIIAQAQTQGLLQTIPPKTPEEAARRKDIADKTIYGIQPWREREAVQGGYLGPKITVMTPQGPATMIPNKRGDAVMGMFLLPPEYTDIPVTGMYGEQGINRVPKNQPFPGGYLPTAPPPQMIPKGMTPEVTEKVNKLEQFKSQLEGLKEMGQDPKVFGLWANTMAKGADTFLGALAPADPTVLAFHKAMKRIENAQVHEFGGSNLTAQELQRALAGLPRAWNQQDFNTGVDALIKGTENDIKNYYQTYSQSEAQRGSQALGPRPELPQQNVSPPPGYQPTGRKRMGKPEYINPNAPVGQRYWTP